MPALTHGPWLMQVTSTTATWWFRLDMDGALMVNTNHGAGSAAVSGANDWCGIVTIAGLPPQTEITYTCSILGGSQVFGPQKFFTMPTEGEPGCFDVYMLSDHHLLSFGNSFSRQAYQGLAQLLGNRQGLPRLAIQGGDFELHGVNSTDVATRRSDHRACRDFFPEMREFHSAVPLCGHVWDDQDFIGNNGFGKNYSADVRAACIQVFREYFRGVATGPDPDSLYASFLIADCLFIVTDARTYRDGCPASVPSVVPPNYDYATARCWGEPQLQWIKDTLLANAAAPFKFMLTGTTTTDFELFNAAPPATGASGKRDSMGMFYRYERNNLLAWLRDNPACARGLVFLSGDDHRFIMQRSSYWHDPCPWTQLSAIQSAKNYGWPAVPDLKIPSLSQNNENQNLGGSEGGQSRTLEENRVENQAIIMRINTTGKNPSADIQVVSFDRGTPRSILRWETGPEWYLPKNDKPLIQKYKYESASDPGGLFAYNGSLQLNTLDYWAGNFIAIDRSNAPPEFSGSIRVYNAYPSASIAAYLLAKRPLRGTTYRISWWQYSTPNCPIAWGWEPGYVGAAVYGSWSPNDVPNLIVPYTWQEWEVLVTVPANAVASGSNGSFKIDRSDNTSSDSWVVGFKSEIVSPWTAKVPV